MSEIAKTLYQFFNNSYVVAVLVIGSIVLTVFMPDKAGKYADPLWRLGLVLAVLVIVAYFNLYLGIILAIAFVVSVVRHCDKSQKDDVQKLMYYNYVLADKDARYSKGSDNPLEPQYPTVNLRNVSFGPKEPRVPYSSGDVGFEVGTTIGGCYGKGMALDGSNFSRRDNVSRENVQNSIEGYDQNDNLSAF